MIAQTPREALSALLDEVLDDVEHVVDGNPDWIDRDMLTAYSERAAALDAAQEPQPAPELAAARDASDLEVAAIITERNQLREDLRQATSGTVTIDGQTFPQSTPQPASELAEAVAKSDRLEGQNEDLRAELAKLRDAVADVAELSAEMHQQAQLIAPATSEPDGMPDIADQVRAEVLHEYASRIRLALGPDAVREALEGK